MHELSVVFYIIDEVKEVAATNDVSEISKVTLQLGEVSTVIPSYLKDCWKWASAKHRLLETAELEIYSTLQFGKTCPNCGSGRTWLKQGQEFLIKEIECAARD